MNCVALETEQLRLYVASQAEMEQLIERQTDGELKKAHPKQGEWYAIWLVTRHDGVQVGDLSFKGLNEDGSVEIGYGIKDEFQGQGYATKAVRAAVDWALNQDGVLCVEAEAKPDNKVSQRVLAKCGFVLNGIVGEEGPRFVRKHNQ